MTVQAPVSKRSLAQAFPRIADHAQFEGAELEELERILARTREFCDLYVRPQALEYDRRAGENPEDFPWDLARKATEYGLFSLMIPRASGGESDRLCVRSALVMEEMAAACSGVATIFGAHALGVSPLVLGGPALWDGVMHDIVDAERRGEPMMMAAAITEPTAGTDVESPDLVPRAKIVTSATRVRGGYRLNGTKRFISNGSVARWVTVILPLDPKDAAGTMTGFLVDTLDDGFAVSRVEHKMGQRACPAAELTFDDVFVPDDRVIGNVGDGVSETMLVLIASRPVVGAIATGIARGAYERLVSWLITDPQARPLLERQQVQLALASMEEQVHVARQAYLDAATEFDAVSLGRLLRLPAMRLLGKLPPAIRTSKLARRQLESDSVRHATSTLIRDNFDDRDLTRALALSSMAKAHGGDTAMRVTGMALEIAGLSSGAIREELEKLMRDAKLTQIYEGTNQLNRLEVYEGLVVEHELDMRPHDPAENAPSGGHDGRQIALGAAAAKVAALGINKNGSPR